MLEWGIACCGVAYNGIVYYNMVGRPQSHIVAQALNLLSSSLVILGTCLNFLCLILLKIIEVFVLGVLEKQLGEELVGSQHTVEAH